METFTIISLVLVCIMILAWLGVLDGLFDKDESKSVKRKPKKSKKKPAKIIKPSQVVKPTEIQSRPLDEEDEDDQDDADDQNDEDDWGEERGWEEDNPKPVICGRSATITNLGYGSSRGWYDTERCDKKNRYCRWVGEDGGDPSVSTYIKDKSMWLCSTAKNQYGYHPQIWDSSYVKSDIEQY